MLRARDFRAQAWERLNGKWGTMALCALIVSAISSGCGALSFLVVGGAALLLVAGPLGLGWAKLSLRTVRREGVAVEMLFDGFKAFAKAFLLYLINSIFVFLWTLLFIIPGIVKSYAYSMSYYILLDNPELSSNEARIRSMEMMRGHKWRLFCLHFSFIGWWLLTLLTFGILSFWVQPYQKTADAAFYQSLLPEQPAKPQDAPIDPFASEPSEQNAPSEQNEASAADDKAE